MGRPQQIKGLSDQRRLCSAFCAAEIRKKVGHCARRTPETSLIEQFLYPKLGPGQMWEQVAKRVKEQGGRILTGYDVVRLRTIGNRVTAVEARDAKTGEVKLFEGDYFFSTMPVSELIRDIDAKVPAAVREISEGLVYRDFITVGLLL